MCQVHLGPLSRNLKQPLALCDHIGSALETPPSLPHPANYELFIEYAKPNRLPQTAATFPRNWFTSVS
jgi:hypothetical protein